MTQRELQKNNEYERGYQQALRHAVKAAGIVQERVEEAGASTSLELRKAQIVLRLVSEAISTLEPGFLSPVNGDKAA